MRVCILGLYWIYFEYFNSNSFYERTTKRLGVKIAGRVRFFFWQNNRNSLRIKLLGPQNKAQILKIVKLQIKTALQSHIAERHNQPTIHKIKESTNLSATLWVSLTEKSLEMTQKQKI